MCAFSTLTGAIRISTEGVKEGVDDAEQEIDSLDSRMQSAGQSMAASGAKLTAGITGPLAAMGGMAARSAANFDESMQRSMSVMADVDEAMQENLEERARSVANTTTVSATEAADAYYYLASAGLDAAASMEAMPTVAEFSEAAGDALNMAEATDIATNVMSAYGREASELSEITDTLAATTQNHNQTLDQMSQAMSRVAPTASGLGVEIEEVSAALGAMGDAGIQGQRAGTALNRALTVLSNPTGRAAEKLNELGVSVRDSEGNMRSITEIMADFEEAGADSADMAAVFGSEAGPAMAALLQQGSDALEENTDRIEDAEGATEDMAETQRDTLNAEMDIAKSNLNEVGIMLGSHLVPMLSTATEYVKGAAERFRGLNNTQQKTILALGGVLAAAGPVLLALGTLGAAAPAVGAGFGMLSGALGTAAGWANTFTWVLTGQTIPALITTQVTLLGVTAPVWAVIAAVGALAAAWATDFMGIQGVTEDAAGVIGDVIEWLIEKVNEIPGVDIEMGDVPSLGDITGSLPSGSDFVPAGEAMGEGASEGVRNAGPTADDTTPGRDAVRDEGVAAGESYSEGMSDGMAEGIDIMSDGLTPEMREAMESGVGDYVSDPEEMEDTPTEITEELFTAILEQQGSISPDDLGVSDEEFEVLQQRAGYGTNAGRASRGSGRSDSGGTGGSEDTSSLSAADQRDAVEGLGGTGDGTATSTESPAMIATSPQQRGATSGDAEGDRIVQAIEDLKAMLRSLSIEGELEINDTEWDRVVDPRVQAVLSGEVDRQDRGVSE